MQNSDFINKTSSKGISGKKKESKMKKKKKSFTLDAKKKWPKTVEEAVNRLLSAMSKEDRRALKKMSEEDLSMLHFDLGQYIRNEFGLWQGNRELIEDCNKGYYFPDPDHTSSVIIEALWKKSKVGQKSEDKV